MSQRSNLAALLAVGAAMFGALPAQAATVRPYMWTPPQAGGQVVRWNPGIQPDVLRPGQAEDVKSARCGGRGPALRGRYLAFRCTVVFQSRSVRGTPHAATMWVKVRRQGTGQPCVSLKSLAAIPFGCLRTVGTRTGGSVSDAKLAVVQRTAAVLPPECVGYGAGYYLCSYQVGGTAGRAAVSFAPTRISVTLL